MLVFCPSCLEHVVPFLTAWSLDHRVTVSASNPSCLKTHLSYPDNPKQNYRTHLCRTLSGHHSARWKAVTFLVFCCSLFQTVIQCWFLGFHVNGPDPNITPPWWITFWPHGWHATIHRSHLSRSSTAVIGRRFISILLLLFLLPGWHDKHPPSHAHGPESSLRPWLKAKRLSSL